MFRYLVLGLLRDEACQHGYALMKEYRERSGLQISTGNFYRELQRLTAEGLVRTVANPDGADPRRAPYEITGAGIAAFDAWLAHPNGTPIGQYEDELSARVLFLGHAHPAVAERILDRWQEELWMRGKLLERAREAALSRLHRRGPHPFEALAVLLSRRLKHIAADLEFLEELRTVYQESQSAPRAAAVTRPRPSIGGELRPRPLPLKPRNGR